MADELPTSPSTSSRSPWFRSLRRWRALLLVLAVIAGAIAFYLAVRPSGAASTPAGGGVLPLDPQRNHSGRPPAAAIGRAAPDFRLTTLAGQPLRLSDLQGKTVLINFWATWCPPCRQEMPEIVSAYARYRDRGFAVVSVDEQEDAGTVSKWVTEFGMQFPVVLDTSGQVGRAFRAGTQFPTSLFIGPNGIITDIKYGPMDRQYLDQRLARLP